MKWNTLYYPFYHKWNVIIFDYNHVATKLMNWIVK